MASTYLVTGGAGFIGSNIVYALLEKGENVKVLDNLSTGKFPNIEPILDHIEFIQGDICDLDTVNKATKGVDYILHQAALPSVPRSVQAPITSNRVNVAGTLNMLVAARDNDVQRFVMASSSSVYGNAKQLPKMETMLQEPLSPYATSKLAGERYTLNFHSVYGLPTVALRYFNVFGPRQDPKSQYSAVIPKFILALMQCHPFEIHGDGEQSRDFTFVENVVAANLLACQSEAALGKVMNVACGERYTLNTMVGLLEEYIGVKGQRHYVASRKADVKHSQADISLARKCLNFDPKVSFEEGLKRTVDWYRQQLSEK